MRRNKVGPVLIALQIAITLAILSNGLFLIQQRIELSRRPTGADEANVLAIDNQWVGNPPDIAARQEADLAALRSLPGVQEAFASNTVPLTNTGSSTGISLHPDQKTASATAGVYYGDPHAIAGLGLRLVAGRNFNWDEVADLSFANNLTPPRAIIITRALADRLFPDGSAVGKSVYDTSLNALEPIVGVVDRLQVPWVTAGGWGSKFSEYSVIEPFHITAPVPVVYIVRVQPGQMTPLIQAAPKKLFELNGARLIKWSQPLATLRNDAYRDDKGLVVVLSTVCAALLSVTAFGIVGLASYWVAQRRRQIGIRRALGSTRRGILNYFQAENLLIATAGAALGVLLTLSLNLWLVSAFAMERLNIGYTVVGVVSVVLLGQAAVLWPAMKAASISPALATRGS